MAKTKALKKSPFMGQRKAKNRHVSFGKSPVSRERAALPFQRNSIHQQLTSSSLTQNSPTVSPRAWSSQVALSVSLSQRIVFRTRPRV